VTGQGQPGTGRDAAPAGRAAIRTPELVIAAAGGRAGGPRPGNSRLATMNTGGLLYGTIVSAAALSVGAGRGDSAGNMIDAMISTLIIYWLAHVYTATVSGRSAGSAVPLRHRAGAAVRQEAAILAGGLPAVAAVVLENLAGVSLWICVLSGLGVAIVMLAVDGLLAGLHAGVKGWRLAAEIASAAVFGLLIALLLGSLHGH